MTRYARFPRSNVTGNIPQRLDPGSLAVNWADQKLYAGGPTEAAVLVGAPVRDWLPTRAYRLQDIVFRDGSLWRANVAFIPAGPFDPAQWVRLNDAKANRFAQLMGTSVLTPIAPAGRAPAATLTVQGGRGVIVGAQITEVVWNTTPLDLTLMPENELLIIGVNAAGTVTVTQDVNATPAWRRENLRIGHFSVTNGVVLGRWDGATTAQQALNDLYDFFEAFGPFRTEGLDLSLTALNTIAVGRGAYWRHAAGGAASPNLVTVTAPTVLTLLWASQAGYERTSETTQADPSRFDNAGVLQPVGDGAATIQYVWLRSVTAGVARAVISYGQTIYADVDAALAQLGEDFKAFVPPPVVSREVDLLLGAFVSSGDGTDQRVIAAAAFGGGAGGSVDSIEFLRRDGTLPMQGDLDLDGFSLIGGAIDGAMNLIIPELVLDTGDGPSVDAGQLWVNVADRKVYAGSSLVADRITPYSIVRLYAIDDLTIAGGNLYRCITPVTAPEDFDPLKWEIIGSDSTDPASGAVITAPQTADRNEIDLTSGGGGAKAFGIIFDESQSVPVADFGPRASIDRYGVPKGYFGEHLFVVTQPSHGAINVGTAIRYDTVNGKWAPADATAEAKFPTALVAEVIDENTFVAQIGGRINNLSPAAFVGGTIVPGTYYYASTTPGLLTSSPAGQRVPVLYAISPTTGLLKLTGTLVEQALKLEDIYPVGAIYITMDPTLPPAFTKNMTWAAFAQGRALVGVGTADGEAWTAGQQKGAAKHKLLWGEMPVHSHGISVWGSANHVGITGFFDMSTTLSEPSNHVRNPSGIVSESTVGFTSKRLDNNNSSADMIRLSFDASHSHGLSLGAGAGNAGGDQAHNNIQPSIGVYMWRRTA